MPTCISLYTLAKKYPCLVHTSAVLQDSKPHAHSRDNRAAAVAQRTQKPQQQKVGLVRLLQRQTGERETTNGYVTFFFFWNVTQMGKAGAGVETRSQRLIDAAGGAAR